MKNLKTLFVTVGLGSAVAFFLSNSATRQHIVQSGKKIKKVIRGERKGWEDDNEMKYI